MTTTPRPDVSGPASRRLVGRRGDPADGAHGEVRSAPALPGVRRRMRQAAAELQGRRYRRHMAPKLPPKERHVNSPAHPARRRRPKAPAQAAALNPASALAPPPPPPCPPPPR